jgi:UrcA family protein
MRIPSLIAFALVATAPAYAQPPITVLGDAPTATVSAADLNLHTATGQARLQARVADAAETLCMDRAVRDIARTASGLTCLNRALASARPQIERLASSNMSPADLATATIVVSAKH